MRLLKRIPKIKPIKGKKKTSVISHIANRLKQVDEIHGAGLQDARRLKTEGTAKYNECSKKILEVQKKLDADPTNKQLQEDKAALVVTRDMMLSSVRLNESLLKNG